MPSVLAKERNGLALWTKNDLKNKKLFGKPVVFEEMLLRDESVIHLCPAKHTDYLYSYILVDVPAEKLVDILTLSGSVGYDPLKKLLYGRCASLSANIATLSIESDIILNKITIEKVHKQALYKKAILKSKTEAGAKQQYNKLYNNMKKLGRPKLTGVFETAFPLIEGTKDRVGC